jgi:hypothetical protein
LRVELKLDAYRRSSDGESLQSNGAGSAVAVAVDLQVDGQ